jgi:hypothetical protein
MNELIEQIKTIMTDVATGKANIQDTNDEYKRIFQELDDLFIANNIKNPNLDFFGNLFQAEYNLWKNLIA